jgi:hypothetical protein
MGKGGLPAAPCRAGPRKREMKQAERGGTLALTLPRARARNTGQKWRVAYADTRHLLFGYWTIRANAEATSKTWQVILISVSALIPSSLTQGHSLPLGGRHRVSPS